VAPWRSTFKIHLLTDTEVTYLLTSGGHNAGIVSEPGHPNRRYQVKTKAHEERYVDPDTWIRTALHKDGSWWPEWTAWLTARSAPSIAPPAMGAALADAPGTYVLQA
jgi:polyhydroxyalkanoate synthase subunit PhaC